MSFEARPVSERPAWPRPPSLPGRVLPWLLLCACSQGTSRCVGSSAPAPRVSATFTGQPARGEQVPVTRYIVVDQFGYRPDDRKVAVLASPARGWNARDEYWPGGVLEVRRFDDAGLVYRGSPVVWNNGDIDLVAGDRGSWFDFSSVREPGSYFLYDPANRLRSYRFEIGRDVYRDVLKAAQRAFYFNRANMAKRAPYACVKGKCWLLGENYLGPRQDRDARNIDRPDDARSARDLSGGWWDAGDVNKYVTFAQSAVHQLLTAYWEKPGPFGDDFGIPESGNQVPDLLDEVAVELDWLEKMQPDDLGGGVLLKVGNVEHGDPVPDRSHHPRFYYPEPCSSSTIAAASMFAHAALIFGGIAARANYARELARRAELAYAYYRAHPRSTSCDDERIKSGDGDRSLLEQDQAAVVASVYLFALTGQSRFDQQVRADFGKTRPFREDRWSAYDPEQGDALLYYASLPNADLGVKRAILERKQAQGAALEIYAFRPELDLYRAYMRLDSYHWGSNMVRANYGNTIYDLLQFHLLPEGREAQCRERVAGLLHFFHGVNPMQLVYLSNMAAYGAERSVTQIFHAWFRDGDPKWDSAIGSELGPAPGYLAGGPNRFYCDKQDPAENRCATSELRRQPPGKAYLDFNTGWDPRREHDRSWEITEPGIYYQAAYVKLLSKFVD